MTTINIDRREVPKTNRNGRINTVASSGSSSSTASSTIDSNQFLTKDASLVNYILDLPVVDGSGSPLFRYDSSSDYIIFNKTIASNKEVMSYYDSSVVVDPPTSDLTTYSFPLVKDVDNNVTLVYDPSTLAVDVVKGLKSIAGGTVADSSVYWNSIVGKPTFATVATSGSYTDLTNKPTLFSGAYSALTGIPSTFAPSSHTLGVHSDIASYFTGYKALTASVADSANAVTWSNVSGKPSFATVATSGSYTDLTNKPTIYSTIASLTDVTSYFTGTKANTASIADAALSINWSLIASKPSFATVATSGSYSDLSNRPITSGTQNKLPKFNTTTTLGDSNITDTGSLVTISTSTTVSGTLGADYVEIKVGGVVKWRIYSYYDNLLFNNASGVTKFQIDQSGNAIFKGEVTAFG